METAKLVNKGLAGEPEHVVLQNITTNKIFEFSQIQNENVSDNDLSNHLIQSILQNGHLVNYTETESNKILLHI